jgi:hypothetical protein
VNEDVVINKDQGIQFYHPDYRALISNAVENAIINNSSFDVICQLITAKGNQKWVRSVGKRAGDKLVGKFSRYNCIKK